MRITFAPRGIVNIDDARIIFRNFAGAGSKYNREGDRNFAVVIPDEAAAEALSKEGWNVRVRAPRDDGDTPFMYLPVKVKFNGRGPNCYLVSGRHQRKLDEESVECLDEIDILSVDLDIRPYDWDVSGRKGRTAYLQSIRVTQNLDRFAEDVSEDITF